MDAGGAIENGMHPMRFRQQRSHRNWMYRQFNNCTTTTIVQWLTLIVLIIVFIQIDRVQHLRALQRKAHLRGNIIITTQLREQWVTGTEQPFNYNGVAMNTKHLIVVAGHSVTVSGHLEDAAVDERDWFLLDYQKNRGLPAGIIGHIKAGIQHAAADPLSLLIFSGGQTRSTTGPESEGSSYYRVADAMQLWTHNLSNQTIPSARISSTVNTSNNTVRARTITEEFATDSFENLLFSICRFHEVTGSYPSKITLVSFTFKEHRFKTLHVPALQYPIDRFEYVGVDPPASTGFNLEESIAGELQNAAKPFETDPYGCHSEVLQEKRKSRNPFFRTPPYELTCPDMKKLLNYCGPDIINPNLVPW